MKLRQRVAATCVAAALLASGLSGCSSSQSGPTMTLWTHTGGNDAELTIITDTVKAFNASHPDVTITVESFPQRAYNDAITTAAASHDLPCLLDLDGPIMPNWAWAGYLAPLETFPKEYQDQLLPSALGRWDDTLYSLGPYDTAVAFLARPAALRKIGARIPDVNSPWTVEEFDEILAKLKQTGDYDFPVDMATSDTAEWWPYGYAPLMQSAGGDLVDRETYQRSNGILNSAESVRFATWFHSLFARGFASKTPTVGAEDFLQGRTALAYTGGWNFQKALERLGDDVMVIPPIDLGTGPHVGAGSWQWAVSSNCPHKKAAEEFLHLIMADETMVAFSNATGVFPSRESALEKTKFYHEDGVLRPFFDISKRFQLKRPPTPGYAVISSTFDKALRDIMNGSDPQATLDQAARDIEANIRANRGYHSTQRKDGQ